MGTTEILQSIRCALLVQEIILLNSPIKTPISQFSIQIRPSFPSAAAGFPSSGRSWYVLQHSPFKSCISQFSNRIGAGDHVAEGGLWWPSNQRVASENCLYNHHTHTLATIYVQVKYLLFVQLKSTGKSYIIEGIYGKHR